MNTSTLVARVDPGVRRHPGIPRWAVALCCGVLGFAVAVAGSWNPSLWGDEAATILAARRSLPSLFTMLGHVDSVHGAYYLFMHFWIRVWGTSELAVRFPSAIANGFTVAAVFVLGSRIGSSRIGSRRLGSRWLGVVAAVVCAVLPRMSLIGDDARSYAISTALAAWLTILLVWLLERQETRWPAWLGYAAGVALGIYVFLYLGLMILVHGVFVLAFRRPPGIRRRWIQSAAIGVVATLPVVVYGIAQRAQIAFLAQRDYATLDSVLAKQWFATDLLAAFAWTFVAVGVVVGVLRLRRTRVLSQPGVLIAAWVVIPTTVVLVVNLVSPAYNMRYVSMSMPAVSIAIAFGIVALRRRWLVVLVTVAFCLAAAPRDIDQRSEFADDQGSDWRQVSQWVATHSAPGDAIAFDDTVRNSRLPRLAMRVYPQDYRGLVDVQLVTPYNRTTGLWDRTASLTRVKPRLDSVTTVILLELRGSRDRVTGRDIHTLEKQGFVIERVKTVNRTVVYTLTRESGARPAS